EWGRTAAHTRRRPQRAARTRTGPVAWGQERLLRHPCACAQSKTRALPVWKRHIQCDIMCILAHLYRAWVRSPRMVVLMLRVLANRSYRRLFYAQVMALAGTGLATVALALLAYDLAPSQAGRVVATALTIKMLAYVGAGPLL